MSIDYKEALKLAQQRRKETAQIIDTYTLEIDGTAEIKGLVQGATECATYTDSWEYRDRLEEMKGSMYRLHKSYSRNLSEAQEHFKDGMRDSMARTKNAGAMAWQERQAQYETSNISAYKLLVQFERMIADIENFNKYLNGRLAWIKDRQFWLNMREKNSRE